MMQRVTKNTHFFILLLVVAIAFVLRAHNYWVVPLTDETADEIAWTWLGASLLVEGQPTAWSFYSQYENGHIYKEGIVNAPLVRPAVDHPPLFSLIPGFMHAVTSEWEAIPSRKVIRLPMVFLGTLNVLLLYYVAKHFFNAQWSLVATTVYATAPVFVLSSRLVVAENLLITWTMLFLLFAFGWLLQPRKQTMFACLLVCITTLAILTKISGVVLPVTLLAFALFTKNVQLLKVAVVGLGTGIAILLLYMLLIDLPLFISIQLSQADRLLGLTTLYSRFFIHPTVAKFVFIDGWFTLGLIASIVFCTKKTQTVQEKLFQLLFLITIGFIITTTEEYSYHGWYNYMLFPLFGIALADLAKQIHSGNTILGAISWILLLPATSSIFTQLHLRDMLSNLHIRLLYLLGFIPLFGQELLQSSKIGKMAAVTLACLLVVINCISVLSITEFSVREANNHYFFVQPHNDVR